jgi:hypothetical protein
MVETIDGRATGTDFRIYIDGSLHLVFKLAEFRGLKSWMEPDKVARYRLAIHVSDAEPVICEYSTEARWRRVLELIDGQRLEPAGG